MTFLNKELREDMADALVDHGFKAALEAANTARKEAGDKVYAHIFAAHLEAINSLPADFFYTDNDFKIAINGQRRKVHLTERKRLHSRCNNWHYEVALFPARAEEIQANCRFDSPVTAPVMQSSRDELAEAIMLAEIEHRGLPSTQSAAEMQVNACRYYSMADAMIEAREVIA